MNNALRLEEGDELREIGVKSHVAIFGLEDVRELVEEFAFWNFAIYRVVLFAALENK